MTFTAQQIDLPANVTVPTGSYAVFTAMGDRFLRVEARPTNWLGMLFRALPDGRFERSH